MKSKLSFNEDEFTELAGIEYFRSRIFSSVMSVLFFFNIPIFIVDMIIRIINRDIISLLVDIALLSWLIVLIKLEVINEALRRVLTVATIYLSGIAVIIFTARIGIGMTLILFSMITAGIILDKKHAIKILGINMLVFIGLTLAMLFGYFDNLPIQAYKSYWLVNVMVVQFAGIVSFFLMNLIFEGFKKQVNIIKDANIKIVESEEKHKAMISNISDIIILTDINGVIKYVSPNITAIYGWKPEELLGEEILNRIYHKDKNHALKHYSIIHEKYGFKKIIEIRYNCKNGDVKNIEATAVNLLEDPNIKGILINYRDITESKEREKRVKYLNYHDTLTGLYNRLYFEKSKDNLDTEEHLPISIIYADVNGLKVVNDSFGHAEGDKLLIASAQAIKSCCRENDIVARVGGDEFYILLPNTTNQMAEELIIRINKKCEDYNINNSNEVHYLSIAFGAATKTSKEEYFDDILKIADDRMYRNKLLKKKETGDYALFTMKKTLFRKIPQAEEQGIRVSNLSRKLGEKMNLSKKQLKELELLAIMRDIGKINIADKISNKTNKLKESEISDMRDHCETGYRIAKSVPKLRPIADCIFSHHERWDGTGYPKGLTGKDIPLLSRIVSVVEAYDNIVSKDPENVVSQYALKEVMKKSGTQLDPKIVELFSEVLS